MTCEVDCLEVRCVGLGGADDERLTTVDVDGVGTKVGCAASGIVVRLDARDRSGGVVGSH